MPSPSIVLIALDSVGVDPLGHDRPKSVYAQSRFLFPTGQPGFPVALPDAPREGALVATDVTGGATSGSIECAVTYTSLFSGRSALRDHGLMQGLGLKDHVLEGLLNESNLFRHFDRPCLANGIFPAHLTFLRSGYVDDLVPHVERSAVEEHVLWQGAPLTLRGAEKRGVAELFTASEINQNVFVHAAREAGVPLRTWDHVRRGEALTGSMTHELERDFDLSSLGVLPLPERSPSEAAHVLAGLSAEHDFVFYKYQLADLIAHTGRLELARDVFDTIETFVHALLRALLPDTWVVITSDHGHLEQVDFHQGHPKSLVPTWVFAPDALNKARSLTSPEAIFKLLAAVGVDV
ncbi:hypothetical protein OAX78_00200 [Planctomycetota bacterium]|nr:hypothetical protein [Planctomycetota bacterium]